MSLSFLSSSAEAGPSAPIKAQSAPPSPIDQFQVESSSSSSPSPKVSKKQTVNQLKDGLRELGLDTKGKKETLWRRLVNAIHKASLRDPPTDDSEDDDDESSNSSQEYIKIENEENITIRVLKQPYKSFLCFDVEATCRPGKEFDWPNEIIEFPVVLLQWTEPDETGKRRLHKVDQFRSYVRPTWSPILTDFCKDLTGITQETVDKSPTFPQMLKEFEKWLHKWDLIDDKGLKEALWVTDGPWDLRDFIPKQLHITPPSPFPTYFHGPYLNLKFAVQSVLSELDRRSSYAAGRPHEPPNKRALSVITTSKLGKLDRKNGKSKDYGKGKGFYFNIPGMLEILGLGDFQGRQHSGLDDATNIARILSALSEKDVIFEPNGTLQQPGKGRRYPWMGERGEVNWEDWMSTNVPMGVATSGGVAEAKEAMTKFGKKNVKAENQVEVEIKEATISLEEYQKQNGLSQTEDVEPMGDIQEEISKEEMVEKMTGLVLNPEFLKAATEKPSAVTAAAVPANA
ncbi:uncharacterized protein L201_007672 [Kwoniella dendrophila CBS 6074]|uniref:SAP domain-containing protein n=1 Tax=Kwoniella dendrophila CBS 6074 TaxID=1295534 RepID=A0AAX4K7F9_9TREE